MATSKGSISSPLVWPPFTSHPLTVPLSLASLSLPQPLSASATTTGAQGDIFDQFDSNRSIHPTIDSPSSTRLEPASEHHTHPPPRSPLTSSTSILFPSISSNSYIPHQPPWITATSSTVTAIQPARIPWAALHQGQVERGAEVQDGGAELKGMVEEGDQRTELRVAVGTSDGSLWLFAPPEKERASSSPPQDQEQPPVAAATGISTRKSSFESFRLALRSPTPGTSSAPSPSAPATPSSPVSPPPGLASTTHLPSPPLSPPFHPSAPPTRPRHASTPAGRPSFAHRGSAASIATRRSISGASAFGLGHTTPSGSGAETPSQSAGRARKASATIGISSPTFDLEPPSSGTSFAVADLPSSAAVSRPMSPSLSIASRTSWDLGAPSSSSGLKSPPLPSVVLSSPSPRAASRGKGHSQAKDSITTGIGLWETDSSVGVGASREDLSHLNEEEGWGLDLGEEGKGATRETVEESLDSLEARMRVRLGGEGAVVGLKVVEGLRWGREEGSVLVVLRSDGHLSLHSLVDGRAFGSCQAGNSIDDLALFDGLKIVQLGDTTVSILYTPTTLLIVDLDTLQAQEPIPLASSSSSSSAAAGASEPAIICKQGIHFLVFASSLSPPSLSASAIDLPPSPGAELFVRPLFCLPSSSSSSSTPAPPSSSSSTPPLNGGSHMHSHSVAALVQVRVDDAHSGGRLERLKGKVKGLREVADDLVAWDDEGLILLTIRSQAVVPLGYLALKGVKEICVEGYGGLLVWREGEARGYRLVPSKSGSEGGEGEGKEVFSFQLLTTHFLSATSNSLESITLLPPPAHSSRPKYLNFLVARSRADSPPSATASNGAESSDDGEDAQPKMGAEEVIRSLELFPVPAVPPRDAGDEEKGEGDAEDEDEEERGPKVLFETKETREVVQKVTSSVRIDGERVLLGYSSGLIRETRFIDLNQPPSSATGEEDLADAQLAGAITVLEILEIEGRQVVLAGAVDGSAGAWELSDWSTIGRWNLFASPVSHLACLWDSAAEPKAASTISQDYTLAFISSNSPVALTSLSLRPPPPTSTSTSISPHTLLFNLLFVLPGTASPVSSISISSPSDPSAAEILVVYEQGLARACHLESRELRRSMDRRTAKGVLKEREKGWRTWFGEGAEGGEGVKGSAGDPILFLDLRADLEAALRTLPWSAESKRDNLLLSRKSHLAPNNDGADTPDTLNNGFSSHSPASASMGGQLGLVKMLLSNLVSWGLDEGTDALLSEHLGVERPENALVAGVVSSSALSFPVDNSSVAVWSVSPFSTAQRLLQAVCLLRVFLNFPETERYASQVIVFYASFLQDAVGESFAFPSLDVLADYWLDKSNEVQQVARSLFGTYLAASSDARVLALVERWQDLLPSRQGEGSALSGSAHQALLLTGLVATERYKLLSGAVLKDIALSVGLYLDDDSHPYNQSIATELCSRGFNIWQHYLDAMSLVRQLFGLATGRNPSTPNELRGLARSAVLHVAGINTPLFITTLLHDILSAPSLTQRNATLKLLGFMIRKKPLVLYTSLPRIAEAVVKSLDPTVTDLRETVHQAATVILNELVRTYPSIDFHHKSQRLAVGTHEGSTIIYDLKTATRLYVLESHTRPVTALSWSPDGHRLVSVSLEESKAVVWKVGLGILSMFMPGAPPRQGSGAATQPFKTFEFHVGDEAHMTNAATLEWVVFDWPAERTARLRIRETALNFGT